MMPPLPPAYIVGSSDGSDFVVSHLETHDKRFQGDSRRAIRNRNRAKTHAKKLFHAYEQGGYQAVEGVITGWLLSVIIGIAMQIALRWVERLVETLIQEWLTSGNEYRGTRRSQ